MMMKRDWSVVQALSLTVVVSLVLHGVSYGAPPVPVNNTPGTASVIGPAVPVIEYGTLEGATNDHSGTGLPAIGVGNDDGPDVFYSFTPTATDTYRVAVVPWQYAPLRSSGSERRFVVYVGTDLDTLPTYVDGARASAGGVPVQIDVALTMGTTYTIGVDHDATTRDNCSFTLLIDTIPAAIPDDCASAESIPTTLPYAALNDIDGAVGDFTFTDFVTGRCAVKAPTSATGIDHVYLFHTAAAGEYAFEAICQGFDCVLYIDDSCPPFTPDDCMGASHNAGSGGGKHDLVVVTLEDDKDYWIIVDEDDGASVTGSYMLIVDDAFNYEINEIEPNETTATASPVTTPLNGGQLQGPLDVDWFSIDGLTGDRFYAWANNGGTSNTTIDLAMGFYAADGVTLVEFDDEDCDGASTGPDYDDLDFIYSTSSPVIAGAAFTSDAPHFLNVFFESTLTNVVHRYRLHVGVEPATRAPTPECEPNNTIASADAGAKQFFAGAIPDTSDSDFYAIDVTAGDRVFIALDGDPERDADGFINASSDPKAFYAKLLVYDPDGGVIFDDISDSNTVQNDLPVPGTPDYPAQGGFFIARVTGTHYVEVTAQSTASTVSEESTYELAVFLNDAAPALTDEVDPDVALTPDNPNDEIDVVATDNGIDDTGIGAVSLVDATNLQISGLVFTPGDPSVSFSVTLVNGAASGAGKLVVTDVEGNTTCNAVKIDVDAPICSGFNFSNRTLNSLHDPLHVTDNDLNGVEGTIDVADVGLVTDVNVTMTIESLDTGDLDIYLVSPANTVVELVTDRMSSTGTDMVDTTFDDDGTEILPILGSAAPYTGTWLPEDPAGLAQLIGEQAQGTWKLRVIDDASSEDFGATLVRWSLDLDASFAGPETFAGSVSKTNPVFDEGIASVVLSGAVNVQLNVPVEFTPGDFSVDYTVTLIDPTQNGSGTVTVTDLADNTCQSMVALNGFADAAGPANSGSVSTDVTFKQEVGQVVPEGDFNGVDSTINVPLLLAGTPFFVGEVEVALTVDSDNQGRMAVTLSHGGEFASLVNRIGMDERASSGNTKNSFDVILDDDAPQADDIHEEPALGTVATLGLHQPDGRGEFFGDGITIDKRDNMLFKLANQDATGNWDMKVADTRLISSSENIFRRWAMTLKNPCGAERYVGRAIDLAPGAGICTIAPDGLSVNLSVVASFTAGDEIVDYRVELVDPSLPGSGTIEITDCASNVTLVPVSLAAESGDDNPPVVNGSVNLSTFEFEGSASDNQAGDTGVDAVDLAPWSTNLQLTAVSTLPAATATFTVGLVDPLANGRGYVRVTDGCGLRSYVLVEIDAVAPVCSGSVGTTKRYRSTDTPQALPDNNPAGVQSSILVTDLDVVTDVNITFNITHAFDDDIDMTLTSPTAIALLNDVGSTGNDFIDTTLDDEAAAPIPDSSSEAPFTGSYQPLGGPALFALDGGPAAGTYTLQVVDDKANDTGTFENWALTIESATFPERYDGRVEDGEALGLGVCSIELVNAANLVLDVDPFTPGDKIVRYSVTVDDPAFTGLGTVRVTDCGGNICEVPLSIGKGNPIPTISEWGIVVLALLLLSAGTVVYRRRRTCAA